VAIVGNGTMRPADAADTLCAKDRASKLCVDSDRVPNQETNALGAGPHFSPSDRYFLVSRLADIRAKARQKPFRISL